MLWQVADRGYYELKPEYWKEFDPLFPHYYLNELEEAEVRGLFAYQNIECSSTYYLRYVGLRLVCYLLVCQHGSMSLCIWEVCMLCKKCGFHPPPRDAMSRCFGRCY